MRREPARGCYRPGVPPPSTAPRRRLLTDAHGDLHTARLVGLAVLGLVTLAIGMFGALLAADAGSPETLALWLIGALVLIKAPLLGVLWWVLSRRRDPPSGGGWSSEECGEILAYLETQAGESRERADAPARLAYFAREAWFVADGAADADKPEAVATAMRIEGMALEAGATVDRAPVTRRGGAAPG